MMIKKHFKKLVSMALTAVMVMGMSVTAFASETDNLQIAYNNVISHAAKNNIELDMTFEDFLSNYNGQSVNDYENSFYKVFSSPTAQPYSSSSSGSDKYYYNTKTSCPSSATYSKYDLLDVVQKGDIIYENNGGFGITGHIAIVEGIYSRGDDDDTKYIRIIEAIDVGVVRSILDDTRVDDKAVTILRVSSATTSNKNSAVSFCVSQLGKNYNLDLAKDTSKDEKDWYCSELVWAAYKNQSIDIEVSGNGELGITPHDIRDSSKTSTIAYSEKK